MSDKEQNDNITNSSKDGAIDFSKIKTGGTFLTNVVGSEKVFCKELFSEEEKMIYEAMRDFATNELLPLSQNELNKNEAKELVKNGCMGVEAHSSVIKLPVP